MSLPSHLLSPEQIQLLGFAAVGSNVRIDQSVRFFGAERIAIGDNVRIDPFCILSAGAEGVSIGRNVHIAAYCSLFGQSRIELRDFVGLSARVSIYSSTDDYTGGAMTNPTVPKEFTNVRSAPVVLDRHVIIGTGSVILPGVVIGMGASVGATTLIRKDVPEFAVVAGNPARVLGERGRNLLDLETMYLNSETARRPDN